MSTEVVLAGNVCIDVNVSENTSYTGWGSALMYIARYFSRHQPDVKSVLVAPYGQDFLQYAGGLTLLPGPRGDKTLLFKNLSRGGRRTQECQNADTAAPPPITSEIAGHLQKADIICLAPLLPDFGADYMRRLMQHKKAAAKTVLLPQGYFRKVEPDGRVTPGEFDEAADILPLFDMIILSEDDHPDSHNLTRQWAAMAPDTRIILTLGAAGASWVEADRDTRIEVEPVSEDQIVDSVGCGDTFSAAAMYEYWRGGDVLSAIKAGNTAARAKLFEKPVS